MAEFAIQPQGVPLVAQPPAVPGATVQLQQPLPIQQQPPVQNIGSERRNKYKKIFYGLGITEIIFGCISILFAVLTIIIAANNMDYPLYSDYSDYVYYSRHYHGVTFISQGIWCGIFLVVTGTLGVKIRSNPSTCMYNANMGLSIISACLMVPLMVLSAIAAGVEASNAPYGYQLASLIGLHSLLAIIGFVAAILCIVHSAYCCAGVCNYRQQYGGPIMYAGQPYGNQQMVMLQNGQYVPVQMQPYPFQGYPTANAPMAGAQVVYQPPQGQVFMPQMVMQPPPGQAMAPGVVPQVQSQPPAYNEPQMTQVSGTAPQQMGYPVQSVPQQVQYPVQPTAPSVGSKDALATQLKTDGAPGSNQ